MRYGNVYLPFRLTANADMVSLPSASVKVAPFSMVALATGHCNKIVTLLPEINSVVAYAVRHHDGAQIDLSDSTRDYQDPCSSRLDVLPFRLPHE
jgi:hypothetical protein